MLFVLLILPDGVCLFARLGEMRFSRRLGAHSTQRYQPLQIFLLTLRTLGRGRRRQHQKFKTVPASAAFIFINRHTLPLISVGPTVLLMATPYRACVRGGLFYCRPVPPHLVQSRLNCLRNRGEDGPCVTQPNNTRCSRRCRRGDGNSADIIGRQRHQFTQVSGQGCSRRNRSSNRACNRSVSIIHGDSIGILRIRVVRDCEPNLGSFPRIGQDLNLPGRRRRKHRSFGEFGSV